MGNAACQGLSRANGRLKTSLTTQVEAQQKISQARHSLPRGGGDKVEARARRRYPRRWHGLQHANDQIEFSRTPALEQDEKI
jgi:hypothetical protein